MEDLNIINNNIKFTINVNYLENTFQCNEDNESGKFNIVDKSLILIWDNKDIEYYELSDLDDKTYIKNDDNENKYDNENKENNDKINIIHNEWEDIVYLIDNNKLYRHYNNEETATYELSDNGEKLTIYWDKWGVEYFYKEGESNTYKLSQKIKDEIKDNLENINIFHINWTDNCFIRGDIINRSSLSNESGSIVIKDDTLIIHWDKWDSEKFILFNDNKDAYYETMIKSFDYLNMIIFLNLFNNKIYNTLRNEIIGYFCIDNNIIHAIFINNKNNMKKSYQEFMYENNNISIVNKKYTFITDDKIYYLYNNNLKKYFVNDNDQIYYYLEDNDDENNHKFYLLLNSQINEFHIFDEDKMIYINKKVEKNIFNPYLYSRFNIALNNLNHNELILHWLKNSDNKKNIYSIETFLKNNDFFHLNNFKTLNNLFFSDEDIIIYWFRKYKYKNYFYTTSKIDIIYKSLSINNCDILYTIVHNIDDVHTIQNLLYKKPIIIVLFISVDNKDLINIYTIIEKKNEKNNDNTIIIKYQDKNEYLFSNKISEIIEEYSLNINKVFYIRYTDKLCEESLLNSIYNNKFNIIIKDDIEYEIKINRIGNILLEMLHYSDNYYDSIKILIIYTIYIRKIFSKFEDMVILKMDLFNEMINFFSDNIFSIRI